MTILPFELDCKLMGLMDSAMRGSERTILLFELGCERMVMNSATRGSQRTILLFELECEMMGRVDTSP